jgi:hypothetical protein
MIFAILALACTAVSPQDKVPPKTLEERLKELEERLGALEKRHKVLADENQTLEKRLSDAKAAKENFAKQSASGWVRQYARPVDFTEKQSAELEELWLGWVRSDFDKPADGAAWKSREEAIKGRLSAEQIVKLGRAVHDEQEKAAKMSLSGIAQMARISKDHVGALEKAVLPKISIPEDIVLPQAHPEGQFSWFQIAGIAEKALPDLGSNLSEEEISRLRDMLGKFNPRR